MTNSVTIKAVNNLIEFLNDVRFNTELFGSAIANADERVDEMFEEIMLSYLNRKANDYVMGVAKLRGTQFKSEQAYEMLRAYYQSMGWDIKSPLPSLD
jgi:hypothetical protein